MMTYAQALRRLNQAVQYVPKNGRNVGLIPARLVEVRGENAIIRTKGQGKLTKLVPLTDIKCWHSRDAQAGISDEGPMQLKPAPKDDLDCDEITQNAINGAVQGILEQATPLPPAECLFCGSNEKINVEGLCQRCADEYAKPLDPPPSPAPSPESKPEEPVNSSHTFERAPGRSYWVVVDIVHREFWESMARGFCKDVVKAKIFRNSRMAHTARSNMAKVRTDRSLFVVEVSEACRFFEEWTGVKLSYGLPLRPPKYRLEQITCQLEQTTVPAETEVQEALMNETNVNKMSVPQLLEELKKANAEVLEKEAAMQAATTAYQKAKANSVAIVAELRRLRKSFDEALQMAGV